MTLLILVNARKEMIVNAIPYSDEKGFKAIQAFEKNYLNLNEGRVTRIFVNNGKITVEEPEVTP